MERISRTQPKRQVLIHKELVWNPGDNATCIFEIESGTILHPLFTVSSSHVASVTCKTMASVMTIMTNAVRCLYVMSRKLQYCTDYIIIHNYSGSTYTFSMYIMNITFGIISLINSELIWAGNQNNLVRTNVKLHQ